jgi:DNA-binding transcriptional ArsR family regulator
VARGALRQSGSDERLDLIFHALSHRTRRELLAQLTRGPATVSELASGYDMSLPAISKHLQVLERAALVERTQQGRVHRCVLTAGALVEAEEWMALHRLFWEQQLDRLAAHLAARMEGDRPSSRPTKRRRS